MKDINGWEIRVGDWVTWGTQDEAYRVRAFQGGAYILHEDGFKIYNGSYVQNYGSEKIFLAAPLVVAWEPEEVPSFKLDNETTLDMNFDPAPESFKVTTHPAGYYVSDEEFYKNLRATYDRLTKGGLVEPLSAPHRLPSYEEMQREDEGVRDRKKVASDGGSTSYYDIPDDVKDVNDLILHIDAGFARGNILKAVIRMGCKEGVPVKYDTNKIRHFCDVIDKAVEMGKRV